MDTEAARPGLLTRLLGRLSVGRKLLLIYLLDLSAVIFISGILINEKFIAIDFGRKELAGNAYIGELRQAMLAVARAEAGDAQPLHAAALAQRVREAEARHGEGMASGELAQALAAALQALAGPPTDAAAREAARDEVLARAAALVRRVGNQSNLILDPDLDSYYTMSVVLLRLPELLELNTQIGHQLARREVWRHAAAAAGPDAARLASTACARPAARCWTDRAAPRRWPRCRPNSARCCRRWSIPGRSRRCSWTACCSSASTASSSACGCTWARRCSCC